MDASNTEHLPVHGRLPTNQKVPAPCPFHAPRCREHANVLCLIAVSLTPITAPSDTKPTTTQVRVQVLVHVTHVRRVSTCGVVHGTGTFVSRKRTQNMEESTGKLLCTSTTSHAWVC